jgi:hypothetical protein
MFSWQQRFRLWNVTGSIPDSVTGIFHWHNRFGRTVALGSTQPLTEMSTRNLSWGVKAAGSYLTTFMCRLSKNLGASTSWSPKGMSRPVMGLLYHYLYELSFHVSVRRHVMFHGLNTLVLFKWSSVSMFWSPLTWRSWRAYPGTKGPCSRYINHSQTNW